MSKKKIRYTEHNFHVVPESALDWAKLVLMYVVIGPLRLINELSQKIIFLGTEVISRVLFCAIVINGILIVWGLFWGSLAGDGKSFISFPSLILSLAGLFGLRYLAKPLADFKYETLGEVDEVVEDSVLSMDTDEMAAFSSAKSADIAFEESINIFIKNPDELDVYNISAAAYSAAEDSRIINSLSKSSSFPVTPVEIPNLLSEPPIGTQLGDNLRSLQQLVGLKSLGGPKMVESVDIE